MSVTIASIQPVDSPIAVLVQGMHASGTPILAGVISLAGPGRPAPSPDDPLPHLAQSAAVATLNRQILRELGASWNKPGLFFAQGKGVSDSTPLVRELILDRYLDLAVDVARSGAPDAEPIILEDPCLCLLHDLWDTALREAGYLPRTVHAFRHPLEVAASLKASQGILNSRTLQMWVQYNLAVLTERQGFNEPLLVSFPDLLDPDRGLAGRLRQDLGLPAPALTPGDMAAKWRRLIGPAVHEDTIPDQVVARSPVVPSLVKRLYALMTEWEMHAADQRQAAVNELAATLEDQSVFAGNLVQIKLPDPPPLSVRPVSGRGGAPRKLLIHYHLFKNAGTSVDAILRRNFGDRWINTEFPPRGQVDHRVAIWTFIRDNPQLEAISSHTLVLPSPGINGAEILPIVFVRHPLDRMKSAYEFERKQDATSIGAQMAQELDFAGYIRARLAIPNDRSCRDFQVYRLAMAVPETEGTEQERAMAAVDRLPFVGLVEAFKASAERLQQVVQPMFPEFQSFDVRRNVTRNRHVTLEERLDDIRHELGDECFAIAMEANSGDMALTEKVRATYANGA